MNNFVNILEKIADNASLESMSFWKEISLFGKKYYLNQLTFEIFDVLTRGHGTHLSKWEFADSLAMEQSDRLDRIFGIINKESKKMSYEEFHEFCALGTEDDIMELLRESGIYASLQSEYCINKNSTEESDNTSSDDSLDECSDNEDNNGEVTENEDNNEEVTENEGFFNRLRKIFSNMF